MRSRLARTLHQLAQPATVSCRSRLSGRCPGHASYGESSVYEAHDAYRLEEVTQDMLDLVGHLGADKALWIGHDWGSPVVWSMASQYPEACVGVVSLCVPLRDTRTRSANHHRSCECEVFISAVNIPPASGNT